MERGANVAAVAAQVARDAGEPGLTGRVLVNPVTDSDCSRPSFEEDGEGFLRTRALMEWFRDLHTSVTSVDVIVSATDAWAEIGRELGHLARVESVNASVSAATPGSPVRRTRRAAVASRTAPSACAPRAW